MSNIAVIDSYKLDLERHLIDNSLPSSYQFVTSIYITYLLRLIFFTTRDCISISCNLYPNKIFVGYKFNKDFMLVWGLFIMYRHRLRYRCTQPSKSQEYKQVYSDWCHEFEKYKSAMKAWESRQMVSIFLPKHTSDHLYISGVS